MNLLLLSYSLSVSIGIHVFVQSDLDRMRQNYPLATQKEEICATEIDRIQSREPHGPVEIAYHGAYYMLWAKYLNSPLSKLNNFKKGKNLMDKAVKANYGNPEIHFLRLTIQQHAPDIVKYKGNIREDVNQILKKWRAIPSGALKDNIRAYLHSSKLLNDDEQKTIVN